MASRSRHPHARGYEYGCALGQIAIAANIAREFGLRPPPGITVEEQAKLERAGALLVGVVESIGRRSADERKRKAVRRG